MKRVKHKVQDSQVKADRQTNTSSLYKQHVIYSSGGRETPFFEPEKDKLCGSGDGQKLMLHIAYNTYSTTAPSVYTGMIYTTPPSLYMVYTTAPIVYIWYIPHHLVYICYIPHHLVFIW